MEDSKQKRQSNPKNEAQEAPKKQTKPSGSDTLSVPPEGQTMLTTPQSDVGERTQVDPKTPQSEIAPTIKPQLEKEDNEPAKSAEKGKEDLSIGKHIVHIWQSLLKEKMLKGASWTIQLCAGAILLSLLGFNQLPNIPILVFIDYHKLVVLIAVCIAVFLTLILLSLDILMRPVDVRLKAMGAVTGVSILSCLLCFSLLGMTLSRPSWCPASLCPAPKVITKPITTTHGSHDANLDVYFISFQSTAYVIPGNPQKPTYVPNSGDPRSIGAILLKAGTTPAPYTLAIGLHSLYTGRYSLLIDKVTLLVTNVNAVPDTLQVYPDTLLTAYSTTNPARFVYQDQQAHQTIPDTYSPSLLPRVELASGESDQIDAAVESRVPIDIHFRIQVTYHIATEEQHSLILPQVFEVVFSNSANWHPYQLNLTRQNFAPAP